MRRCRLFLDQEPENRTLADTGTDTIAVAMQFEDRLDDGKPQSGADHFPGVVFAAVVFVEDQLDLVFLNAVAVSCTSMRTPSAVLTCRTNTCLSSPV